MSKDFHVTVRVKNGRIIRRMRELGFTSVVSLARVAGVDHVRVGEVIRFARLPTARGDWSSVAYSISAALRCEPEDLWPEHIARLKARSGEMSFEADLEDVQNIATQLQEQEFIDRANLPKLLAHLNERQRNVITSRFGLGGDGERTFDEVALEHGVSKERIRQIEIKALRKMAEAHKNSVNDAARKTFVGGRH